MMALILWTPSTATNPTPSQNPVDLKSKVKHTHLYDGVDLVDVLHPHTQVLVEPPLPRLARHIEHTVLGEHGIRDDIHLSLKGADQGPEAQEEGAREGQCGNSSSSSGDGNNADIGVCSTACKASFLRPLTQGHVSPCPR